MAESEPATETDGDRTTIETGRNFETTYRLDPSEVGEFLVELGTQLRDRDELTVTGDEWELPFAVGGPVELELEFEGVDEPELEIEVEIPRRPDENAPAVE